MRLFLPDRDLDHVVRHSDRVWENLRGQSVFLTGGTGFVGTWLLASLLRANEEFDLHAEVTVLTRNPDRFHANAPELAGHPSVTLLQGNGVDFKFPAEQFSLVIHAATDQAFDIDAVHPLGPFDVEIEATRRVLEFARTHGTRRLIFTSSGAIYGKQPSEVTHVSEEYMGAPATTDSRSAYGQAKRVSEFMCSLYSRVYGFDAMIARLFAFVGPHLPLDANFAVGNFIRDALDGTAIRITGDGTPYRSYMYASDMAVWLWTILARGKSAHPYNVGSTEALTIQELAENVRLATRPGTPIEIAARPASGASVQRYVPCTARAESEFGLKLRISVSEGIRRTFDWHKNTDRRGAAI